MMMIMIIIVILSLMVFLTLSKNFNKISHKLKKFRCNSRKSCLSHYSREAQQYKENIKALPLRQLTTSNHTIVQLDTLTVTQLNVSSLFSYFIRIFINFFHDVIRRQLLCFAVYISFGIVFECATI